MSDPYERTQRGFGCGPSRSLDRRGRFENARNRDSVRRHKLQPDNKIRTEGSKSL
jgi:hypothetical protein